MQTPQVLISGAGPTGLVLALWLAKNKIPVRIIDSSEEPGRTSRAIAIHARTLEFYRQLGVADDVIAGGIISDRLVFRHKGKPVAVLPLQNFGQELSPYPYVLSFPQDYHERVLITHLEACGVKVERRTELLSFEQDTHGVHARIRSDRGEEQLNVEYLCGCDGARSFIRTQLGLGFPGGTYEEMFYVADAEVAGPAAEIAINVCMTRDDFCLVIPMRNNERFRLIGIVPPEKRGQQSYTFEDVLPSVARTTGLEVRKTHWFSTYHVHHRVADKFGEGRVFLTGDAGHIHSPAGGQGMNTGIGDAINLAWKLAAVLQHRAAPRILDSFEPERIAFARRLVSSTDRAFQIMVNRSWLGALWRVQVLPRIAALILRYKFFSRRLFKLLSQTQINYRHSILSRSSAGKIKGGDRLPWVEMGGSDNFAPLSSLDWQLHVYGQASKELEAFSTRHRLFLHCFPWTEASFAAGLAQNAIYLVRPDGYVGCAVSQQNAATLHILAEYLNEFSLHSGFSTSSSMENQQSVQG